MERRLRSASKRGVGGLESGGSGANERATSSQAPRADQACQKKIRELRRFKGMLQEMLAKFGNGDAKQTTKIKELLKIFSKPHLYRGTIEVLERCELQLRHLEMLFGKALWSLVSTMPIPNIHRRDPSPNTSKRMRMEVENPPAPPNLHLFALPEVVQDQILSYLTLPEQLKVRQLCRITKGWVDRNCYRLAEHIPASIVKDHGQNSFRMFLRRLIPLQISSLHLDNLTLDIYNTSPHMSEFLQRYSESITSVRAKRFFVCSDDGKQARFFEQLTNLTSVEFDEIWVANADDIASTIPQTFRRLTSLKFGKIQIFNEPNYTLLEEYGGMPHDRRKSVRWHVWNILDVCESLRHLRVPISPKHLFDNAFDECFRLLNYIRIRTAREAAPPVGQYVMQCDLLNFVSCHSSLEVLLIIGSRMRIQFHNVNTKVFKRGSSFSVINFSQQARFDYIYSLVSSSLINRPFECVQELTFKASLIRNECIVGRQKGPTLFPNLKTFNIIMDIGFDTRCASAVYSRLIPPTNNRPAGELRNICFPRANQVLRFFFPQDLQYNQVHTASITFTDPVFPDQRRGCPDKLNSLPNIISGLPNLENLTLVGWTCKRETYLKLWEGFSDLKRLVIDGCPSINPGCFITGNGSPNNPANMQHLEDLEYVELRGLDEMPGLMKRIRGSSQVKEVFTEMGFIPLDYLSKKDSKKSIWTRTCPALQKPRINPSTIVTRSVSSSLESR